MLFRAYECSFCATGKMGYARNLTPDEIARKATYSIRNIQNPRCRRVFADIASSVTAISTYPISDRMISRLACSRFEHVVPLMPRSGERLTQGPKISLLLAIFSSSPLARSRRILCGWNYSPRHAIRATPSPKFERVEAVQSL